MSKKAKVISIGSAVSTMFALVDIQTGAVLFTHKEQHECTNYGMRLGYSVTYGSC